MNYENIVERMLREEPLRPELRKYVVKTDGRYSFQHPLHIESAYFDPNRAAQVHFMLDTKAEEIREHLEKGEIRSVIRKHERPYRPDAFIEYQGRLTDRDYWECLAGLWTDTESPWVIRELWLTWFNSDRAERQFLMKATERKTLEKLPDPIPIYRGYRGRRGKGLSWTIDRDKAIWYANRTGQSFGAPMLATGRAQKSDVLAYFAGREESEIVIDPDKVRGRKTERL